MLIIATISCSESPNSNQNVPTNTKVPLNAQNAQIADLESQNKQSTPTPIPIPTITPTPTWSPPPPTPTPTNVPLTDAMIFDLIKREAVEVSWGQLYFNESRYEGEFIYFKGVVIQMIVEPDTDDKTILMCTDNCFAADLAERKVVIVNYTGKDKFGALSVIEVTGFYYGLFTYMGRTGELLTYPMLVESWVYENVEQY